MAGRAGVGRGRVSDRRRREATTKPGCEADGGGGWDAWGTAMMRVDFDLPARLITDAAEAEADPASRWPIAAKETDDAR